MLLEVGLPFEEDVRDAPEVRNFELIKPSMDWENS